MLAAVRLGLRCYQSAGLISSCPSSLISFSLNVCPSCSPRSSECVTGKGAGADPAALDRFPGPASPGTGCFWAQEEAVAPTVLTPSGSLPCTSCTCLVLEALRSALACLIPLCPALWPGQLSPSIHGMLSCSCVVRGHFCLLAPDGGHVCIGHQSDGTLRCSPGA